MSIETKNARIRSADIFVEDHGILTAFLDLDYGGCGQGFGGYGMDRHVPRDPALKDDRRPDREGVAWGMEFIRRVMSTVGVEKWSKLPGTPIRVRSDWGKVHEIGHFIEDRWFHPERDLAHLAPPNSRTRSPSHDRTSQHRGP